MVLDSTPAPFCLELAALAARREYLNLEKWLSDQFTAKGSAFMQASVSFLDSKLRSEQPALQAAATAAPLAGTAGGGRILLAEATLEVFLRVLAGNAGLLPSDTLQQFKMVQGAAVQQHPQLAAVVGDSSSLEAFAPDIGEWAPACCCQTGGCCQTGLPPELHHGAELLHAMRPTTTPLLTAAVKRRVLPPTHTHTCPDPPAHR
jgi:hypothetical protein